ncbi:MAG: M24 family metallopeptidase [Actinomycetota bacterium]
MLFNKERAYRLIQQADLDAVVGATPVNAYYISDAKPFFLEWDLDEAGVVGIVPADPGNDPILVIQGLYISYLMEVGTWVPKVLLYDWFSYNSVIFEVREPTYETSLLYRDWDQFKRDRVIGKMESNVVEATASALKEARLNDKRVGFDDLRLANAIKELPGFDRMEVVDAYNTFIEIRKVRSPEELRLHRLGALINYKAITEVLDAAAPGVSYSELARLYRRVWAEHGGRATSDKGLLWASTYKGEHVPVHFTLKNNDFPLEHGKQYIFELYSSYRGYTSDGSRTLFLGEPPKSYLQAVDATMRAHQAIEPELEPGKTTDHVYRAAMGTMEASGIPGWSKTVVATHGIGLDAVEWYTPYPAQRSIPQSFLLEENVVIGMDVLFYGEEVGPFHFENQIVITAHGVRSFFAPNTTPTVLPKGLAIKDGDSISWYCPSDVTLQMDRGIPEELILDDYLDKPNFANK